MTAVCSPWFYSGCYFYGGITSASFTKIVAAKDSVDDWNVTELWKVDDRTSPKKIKRVICGDDEKVSRRSVIAEYMKEILQCYHKNIVGT